MAGVHTYVFKADAGSFQRISVFQNGVDVATEVRDEHDEVIVSWDSISGSKGPEWLVFESPRDSAYMVHVKAYRPHQAGTYTIVREEASTLGERERKALRAFEAMRAGEDLWSDEETDRAIAHFETARTLFAEIGDQRSAALAVFYQGKTYKWTDHLLAEKRYRHAGRLFDSVGDRHMTALALQNVGVALFEQGDYLNAISTMEASLAARPEPDYERAQALEAIGLFYYHLGNSEKTRTYFEESIAIRKTIGDPRAHSRVPQLGTVLVRLGDKRESHRFFEQVESESPLGDDLYKTLAARARAELESKDYRKALATYGRAIAVAPAHMAPRLEINRAECLLALGDWREAERACREASKQPEGYNNLELAHIDFLLARVLRTRGDDREALTHLEKVRERLTDITRFELEPDTARELMGSRFDYSALMLDLLVAVEPERALTFADQLRATHLLGRMQGRERLEGVTPAQRKQLDGMAHQIREHLLGREPGSDGPLEDPELNGLIATYERYLFRITRYRRDVRKPIDLDQARTTLLDEQTTLLYYASGLENKYLWIMQDEGIEGPITLGAREAIDTLTRDLAARLTETDSHVARHLIEKASDILLGPVAQPRKRLIVVPDTPLQYLPFAVLERNDKPLIADHQIAYTPSLAVATTWEERGDRGAHDQSIVLYGASTFDRDDDLPRVPREIETIERLADSMEVIIRLNEGFTRAHLFDAEEAATRARYLHFATHGYYVPGQPELSGLVLGGGPGDGDPYLTVAEISRLDLSAELVVLGACETALGRELRGEGLIGISHGFLQAGARGVVSTLWRINDEATLSFMTHFYRAMLSEGLSPARAFSEAQNAMRGSAWSHPRYWAGFVYQGL